MRVRSCSMLVDSVLRERAERAIGEKVFPGCVVGVSRNGQSATYPFGRFTYEDESPEVREDTVYDLASITKAIPTASLALMLIDEGLLGLHEHVLSCIPHFRNDHGTTIEDLLLYRVRGPRMSSLSGKSMEEIYAHIVETGFDGPRGERAYTNLPSYVLGVILEVVTKKPLADLAHELLFRPLGMDSTTYFPQKEKCTPTEIQGTEVIQGIVHDESARVFARARRAVGHAGLFSNAADLLSAMEAILADKLPGVLGGGMHGLGWEHAEGRFGKTGFTGTSIVLDPAERTALVILSNRTYPTRPKDASSINSFRRDIADIVFG